MDNVDTVIWLWLALNVFGLVFGTSMVIEKIKDLLVQLDSKLNGDRDGRLRVARRAIRREATLTMFYVIALGVGAAIARAQATQDIGLRQEIGRMLPYALMLMVACVVTNHVLSRIDLLLDKRRDRKRAAEKAKKQP